MPYGDGVDPDIYECQSCGRLWVGLMPIRAGDGYQMLHGHFTQDDMNGALGYRGHTDARIVQPYPPGMIYQCTGEVLKIYRSDVIAAWHLGGRVAAQALTRKIE